MKTLQISKQNNKFLTTAHNIHHPMYPLCISKNLASPSQYLRHQKSGHITERIIYNNFTDSLTLSHPTECINIRPLDPNSDNASLSSNHVTFFILHSAVKCIMGVSTSHYEIVYLLSYAVCLRSYNILGGGHLTSLFSPSSSNIWGKDTAGYPTNLICLLWDIIIHGRGGSGIYKLLFVSFGILLKLDPYQCLRRHGLDAAGYAKHIIQMNPITNANSSTLLAFYFSLLLSLWDIIKRSRGACSVVITIQTVASRSSEFIPDITEAFESGRFSNAIYTDSHDVNRTRVLNQSSP